jgi:hypothetical protein
LPHALAQRRQLVQVVSFAYPFVHLMALSLGPIGLPIWAYALRARGEGNAS